MSESKLRTTTIMVIPHRSQRYPTVGDYWYTSKGRFEVRVSAMGNSDYEFLVAVHELVESYLCDKRGIPEPSIKEFDEAFERARAQGLKGATDEPGFDPEAPYRKEHSFATDIEWRIAKELGVNWDEYSRVVDSL